MTDRLSCPIDDILMIWRGRLAMRELKSIDIEHEISKAELLARLHCNDDDEPYERALELMKEAEPLLRPSYVIKEFAIDEIKHDGVVIEGNFFQSKIVANKLKDQRNVFVYLATCGRQISSLIDSTEDTLDKYILDQIAYITYLHAMREMSARIESDLGILRYIMLCPGSVIDWSIIDVKKIFNLMDGMYQEIDVEILSSGLIDPLKSISGIFYSTDEEFDSCEICMRANCPSRKAEFDEDLHHSMVNL